MTISEERLQILHDHPWSSIQNTLKPEELAELVRWYRQAQLDDAIIKAAEHWNERALAVVTSGVLALAAYELAGQELHRAVMAKRGSACRGCGKLLLENNYPLADGCPCNSPRGINHDLVPDDVCTCVICDPKQTGSSRRRDPALAQAPKEPPPVATKVYEGGEDDQGETMTDNPKTEWRLQLPATASSLIADEFVIRRAGSEFLISYEALGERGLCLPAEVMRFLLLSVAPLLDDAGKREIVKAMGLDFYAAIGEL